MAQQVDVKGFGLVEFPDNTDRLTMLNALRHKFSQMPANETGSRAEPYQRNLGERLSGGISSALQRTGLVSDNYGANRIGDNIGMALNALPVIGDAIGGDELGRAIKQGDAGGIGFAALGAIPVAGDAAKALSKMDLAKRLGFDTDNVVYHAGSVTDEFDPARKMDIGFHFGTKEQASKFGEPREYVLKYENPLEIDFDPTIIDEGDFINDRGVAKVFDDVLSEMGLYDAYAAIRAGDALLEEAVEKAEKFDELARKIMDSGDYDYRDLFLRKEYTDAWQAMERYLESKGYDALRYENQLEGAGKSIAVFRPSQIRLKEAEFNPEFTDSGNLYK